MPRQSKRQKTTHIASSDSEIEKDDEEKRLESVLFGTSYDFGAEDEIGGNEMGNLRDDELFVVDDGEPQPDSEDDSEEEEVKPKPSKRSAWVDPEDIQVSIEAPRLRKLRESASETHLPSHEYERRLRRQFEQTFPAPAWAQKAKEKARAKQEGDEDDVDTEDLLNSTSAIKKSSADLEKGTISITRLRDPLTKDKAGTIKSLAWHPGKDVPLLAVGSANKRVRLFNIDGHTSPLVLTLHIPSLPITSQSGLSWHPSGKQLLITGSRPFYHIYDLQSGSMKSVGGKGAALWGTRFSSTGAKRGRSESSECLENVAFSPSGHLLAVAGKGGVIHLLDFSSPGQIISSLKLSGGGVASHGLFWSSDTQLIALSTTSEVHVFDIGEKRCLNKWKDEGGWRGSAAGGLAGFTSSDGRGLLSIGSTSGLVNIYSSSSLSSSSASQSPTPLKTLSQLTTPTTSLTFNHDGRILAISSEGKDHLKLYHTESLSPFTNWPNIKTPLGHVSCLGFSSSSEFVAVGNTRGAVGVWRLGAYGVQ